MARELSLDEPPDRRRSSRKKNRTLGPVPSLEGHVRPDWWNGLFNHLYLKTDGDVVDNPEITKNEVDIVTGILGLRSGARMLDLCCGQGRHALELAARGYEMEGLDRSHYLISRARSAAKKAGLRVRFREGNANRLPHRADTFDAVLILGNSFGYFDSIREDREVLAEVRRVLKPGGIILLDLADGEYLRSHFKPRSWEWIDERMFVCRERELSADEQRLISREIISDVENGVVADQFYAERLYSPETMAGLLGEAGFSGAAVCGMPAASTRNQDLGMMEHRFCIAARAEKEWTPVRTKGSQRARHVVVVQGDPRRPDTLKPCAVFDEDDFYTIDAMKGALERLSSYRFTFRDNHENLIRDLSRMKGRIDFVFNLCDEGYDNVARKELHIPALLEMLGIPYTGSGPQALAFCYDKSLVRGVAKEMGIPVPKAVYIPPGERIFDIPFGFPVIVKPNAGDSSIGITQKSVAWNSEELTAVIASMKTTLGYECPFLVEEFLTGADISVGIIGNPPDAYTVLPLSEEDYGALPPGLPPICGYEAKWLPESPYWKIRSVPANLPEETEKLIVRCCMMLFERLECRDYCRFDWRLDAEGQPRLLEVNPNPGWCWDGHLAKMAGFAGISYTEMLGMILEAAEQRIFTETGAVRKEAMAAAVPGAASCTAESPDAGDME
ncbi:MAG: methyltransferase domain-containing protein [Methanomicrobiales archaeon]|nr:methyltransferase domain-containing protein [Methanomicrobiales archaeon]